MDDSGVLTLAGMEAVFEKQVMEEVVGAPASEEEESTLSRLGSTISKLFTGRVVPVCTVEYTTVTTTIITDAGIIGDLTSWYAE